MIIHLSIHPSTSLHPFVYFHSTVFKIHPVSVHLLFFCIYFYIPSGGTMYFVFLFVNISIGTLCLFVHPKGYSKSSGERGNYCIRTYLPFIQHKSPKIESGGFYFILLFKSWFDTEVTFKNPELVYLRSFDTNQHKLSTGVMLYMLDGWEVCSYTIIIHSFPPSSSLWVRTGSNCGLALNPS